MRVCRQQPQDGDAVKGAARSRLTGGFSFANRRGQRFGRYNRTTINNRDRLNPGRGPGSLDGQYESQAAQPKVACLSSTTAGSRLRTRATVKPTARTTPSNAAAPTLDRNNPCNLPNALACDRPLNQAVTRTFEAGVRGGEERSVNWSVGWFRGENHNDLLFVSSPQTGNGYFKNFGQTLRQGVEVHLSGRIRRITLGGNYTFVSATYQSPETVDGSSNSTNDSASGGSRGMDGLIQIQPGDRIPLIPQHLLKAFADFQATRKLSLDLDFVAVCRSYARGNENNQSHLDGVSYLGPGTFPGYGVVDRAAHYQLHKRLQLFIEVDKVLDHHYYTRLRNSARRDSTTRAPCRPPFLPADASGNFPIVHATFYAPGAPFGAWG